MFGFLKKKDSTLPPEPPTAPAVDEDLSLEERVLRHVAELVPDRKSVV